MDKFTAEAQRSLRFYVYVYRDPRDGRVFYVGKGKGNRAFDHLAKTNNKALRQRLKEFERLGLTPEIQIATHGLADEKTAMRVEMTIIDLLGIDSLCNEVRGQESSKYGLRSVVQINRDFAAAKVKITDPCLLIRIPQLFDYEMSPAELYDAVRGGLGTQQRTLQRSMACISRTQRDCAGGLRNCWVV